MAGAPRDCMVPFYEATVPHSYLGWGKTTHLGFGIPMMIGAKMACPDKMCVNLMGDGAFGMSGTDVETSARSVSTPRSLTDDLDGLHVKELVARKHSFPSRRLRTI